MYSGHIRSISGRNPPLYCTPVAPGGSVGRQTRNLLALGREFESRCSHTNWDFSSQNKKIKKYYFVPNKRRTISLVGVSTKFDFTVDEFGMYGHHLYIAEYGSNG